MSWFATRADVDIESEQWRALGSLRFTIGAIQRIIFLRQYEGRLSYLPSGSESSAVVPMPALASPVPGEWVTIDDTFALVTIAQTSHAAHDMHSSPGASLDDGEFTLLILRSTVGRLQLLSMFLAMEDGAHLGNPALECVKAKAYRLEPATRPGNIALDGEAIDYGPVQGHVLPGAARVLSLADIPQSSPLTNVRPWR